jgi:hypothetical protein
MRFGFDVFHRKSSGGPHAERQKLTPLFVKLAMAFGL